VLSERRDSGTALVLISHDLAVVSKVADRVLVMRDGIVVEHGTTAQILTDPQHPYTKALIRAVPSAATRGTRLSASDDTAAYQGIAASTAPIETQNIAESTALLQANEVSKTFVLPDKTKLHAVREVSLSLTAGAKLGIVGESGSGKSTLARILLGLIPPDSGQVLVKGTDWRTKDKSLAGQLRRAVQFISQDSVGSFDPRYTVRDIIAEPLKIQLDKQQREERILELLDLVHLENELLSAVPRSLSGGQRQRVNIARALALRPEVLICDEPVSALDVSIQAQVLDLLEELNQRTGAALVFISHDLGVVHHLVDDVIVMCQGRVVETGQVVEVFANPQAEYTQQLLAAVPTL
jgi:peptide/nickel transport system ATP-binding protein